MDRDLDSALSIIYPASNSVQIYDEASDHQQQQRDHGTDPWAQPGPDTRTVFGSIRTWQEPHPSPLLVMTMMMMILMMILCLIVTHVSCAGDLGL